MVFGYEKKSYPKRATTIKIKKNQYTYGVRVCECMCEPFFSFLHGPQAGKPPELVSTLPVGLGLFFCGITHSVPLIYVYV